MRFFAAILICICLVAASWRVMAAESPRVSGIVGQEGAWVLAIIETSAGGCRVISRGDLLDEGVVSDITAQGIEVQYPDRSEFLPLKGGAFVAMGPTDPALPPDAPRSTSHSISREEVAAALAWSEKKLPAEKSPSVNEVVGLPLAARISSVNGVAMSTQQEAGRILREELEKGGIPRINVTGVPGLTEIYLVPDAPFKPTPLTGPSP